MRTGANYGVKTGGIAALLNRRQQMTTDKRGVSALLLQRLLGLPSYETAWMMLHKLRRAMVSMSREPLRGEIVGGGEKGYQFSGREGARCGVTLWPAVGRRKREEADCFLSQAGLSSLLTSGVR